MTIFIFILHYYETIGDPESIVRNSIENAFKIIEGSSILFHTSKKIMMMFYAISLSKRKQLRLFQKCVRQPHLCIFVIFSNERVLRAHSQPSSSHLNISYMFAFFHEGTWLILHF